MYYNRSFCDGICVMTDVPIKSPRGTSPSCPYGIFRFNAVPNKSWRTFNIQSTYKVYILLNLGIHEYYSTASFVYINHFDLLICGSMIIVISLWRNSHFYGTGLNLSFRCIKRRLYAQLCRKCIPFRCWQRSLYHHPQGSLGLEMEWSTHSAILSICAVS